MTKEPQAAPFFRRWIGADEFINGYERWCLWLGDCPPERAANHAGGDEAGARRCKAFRLASKSAPTRKLADTPTRFHVENMPAGNYLVIPEVSSERRLYIPIGFEQPETFASNLVKIVPNATLYHFGVLILRHAQRLDARGVRSAEKRLPLLSRHRLQQLPLAGKPHRQADAPATAEGLRAQQRAAIEAAAQAVLDARAQFPGATLADLYDPLTMPPALLKAHQALDKAVDAAYGKTGFKSEAERVAFLFDLYQRYSQRLAANQRPAKKPARLKAVANDRELAV